MILFATLTAALAANGHVEASDRGFVLWNDSDTDWTKVTVTGGEGFACVFPAIPAGGAALLSADACTHPPTSLNEFHVWAVEGQFDVPLRSPAPAAPAPEPAPEPARASARLPDDEPGGGAGTPPRAKAGAGGLPGLRVTVTLGAGPLRRLTMYNDSGTQFTSCIVRIEDGTYTYAMDKPIEPWDSDGIMLGRFRHENGSMFTATYQVHDAEFICDQGRARFEL